MKKYFLLVLLLSLCFTQRGERWRIDFKMILIKPIEIS